MSTNREEAVMHNKRAVEYIKMGDVENAIKEYNQAIQCDPNYACAYYNLGNAYIKKGDFTSAVREYTRAIKYDPSDAEAYYNRGNAYARIGNLGQSIEDYTKAIDLDKNYALAYCYRALASSGQDAIDDYKKAIALGMKDDAGTRYNLAWEYTTRFSEWYSENREKLLNGTIKGENEDARNAIKEYSEAIRCDGNYVTAYYGRGLVYLDLGNVKGAIDDFKKTISLDPNHAKAYYHLGNAYLVDDTERAIGAYKKAHDLATNNGDPATAQKAQDSLKIAKLKLKTLT